MTLPCGAKVWNALALLLVLAACSGREAPTTPSGGALAPIPDELAIGAGECESDADCEVTTFPGCCAGPDGTCPCELEATSSVSLKEALDDCAVTECTHGACPPCAPPPAGVAARCVRTVCRVAGE